MCGVDISLAFERFGGCRCVCSLRWTYCMLYGGCHGRRTFRPFPCPSRLFCSHCPALDLHHHAHLGSCAHSSWQAYIVQRAKRLLLCVAFSRLPTPFPSPDNLCAHLGLLSTHHLLLLCSMLRPDLTPFSCMLNPRTCLKLNFHSDPLSVSTFSSVYQPLPVYP